MTDLLPRFTPQRIATRGAEIHVRVAGSGPPLVMVHGFPQTHVMWHRVAPALTDRFTVILMDLRGYGASSVPPPGPGSEAYSKRRMAEDVIDVMAALGHERFRYVGHDRGARVGYRLALDHPQRLEKLAVIDIVPTHTMWHGRSVPQAMAYYHWLFLAQPAPLPERLIGADPVAYLDHTIASWTKTGNLSAFAPDAMAAYRAFYSDPARLSATCHDYRAGATIDLAHDTDDVAAGRRIACPVLVLWGASGIPAKGPADPKAGPLATWQGWADQVRGEPVDSGHFVPEEAPEHTLRALRDFL